MFIHIFLFSLSLTCVDQVNIHLASVTKLFECLTEENGDVSKAFYSTTKRGLDGSGGRSAFFPSFFDSPTHTSII